jgi:hypothetical protein
LIELTGKKNILIDINALKNQQNTPLILLSVYCHKKYGNGIPRLYTIQSRIAERIKQLM